MNVLNNSLASHPNAIPHPHVPPFEVRLRRIAALLEDEADRAVNGRVAAFFRDEADRLGRLAQQGARP